MLVGTTYSAHNNRGSTLWFESPKALKLQHAVLNTAQLLRLVLHINAAPRTGMRVQSFGVQGVPGPGLGTSDRVLVCKLGV